MRDRRRSASRRVQILVHAVGRRVGALLDLVLPDPEDVAPDLRRPAEQIAVAIVSWARAMTVAGAAFALVGALIVIARSV